MPDDLVELGFVPREAIDDLRSSGLTYGITQMLKLAAKGGGPKGGGVKKGGRERSNRQKSKNKRR